MGVGLKKDEYIFAAAPTNFDRGILPAYRPLRFRVTVSTIECDKHIALPRTKLVRNYWFPSNIRSFTLRFFVVVFLFFLLVIG